MKSKGFTLIELLAVIVILAIIALIATPIILNIIEDAKEESAERSVENYIEAVELAVAKANLNGEFNPGTCKIISNGNLECEGYDGTIKVEVDGEVPETEGILTFTNGEITAGSFKLSEINFQVIDGKLEVLKLTEEEMEQRSIISSANKYLSALEEELLNINILDGVYSITSEGKIFIGTYYGADEYGEYDPSDAYDITLSPKSNGTLPQSGSVYIKNNHVIDGSIFKINDYTVNVVNGVSEIGEYQNYTVGTEILYNPLTNEKCGTVSGNCYKWNVLDDSIDSAYVTLLLSVSLGEDVDLLSKDDYLNKATQYNDSRMYGEYWYEGYIDDFGFIPITGQNYLNSLTQNWIVGAFIPEYKFFTGYNQNLPAWLKPESTDYDAYWIFDSEYLRGAPNYSYGPDGNCMYYSSDYNIDTRIRPMVRILKSKLS